MTEDDVRRIALQAILDCLTMPDPTPEQRRITRLSEQFVPVREAAERLLAELQATPKDKQENLDTVEPAQAQAEPTSGPGWTRSR